MKSEPKIILADTFFKRFRGLMLKKDFKSGLLFKNLADSSIHTCFMRFEIDVYFIDETKTVYDKKTLKPWRFYRPQKQAEYILETKKDLLSLKIGDEVENFIYE